MINGYKYLVILEYEKIKQRKTKEIIRREYFRRTKLIMVSRLEMKPLISEHWTHGLVQ